jgi:glycosyltransferase involved in cell wall biosynthesis
MKILQVNSGDVVGGRFNGFDLEPLFAARGVTSKHLVWTKTSTSETSRRFFDLPGSRNGTKILGRIERRLSIHSRLPLQSFALAMHPWFREADLVHYHIVHDGFFSLDAMPMLTRRKPSVWTWHDPWIMTGHCIYPMSCERWKIGCGSCPMLDLPFAMLKDKTAEAVRWKQNVIAKSDIDVIVASKHMRQMAEQSPIGQQVTLNTIPFGIDLETFCPGEAGPARARLGVEDGRVVIGVRAFPESPFKGFEFFKAALERLGETDRPLTIITTHGLGHLDSFKGRHQIIDLGWVNDSNVVLDTFMAADFFVMPSTAEAFGMMAIEAMACGKPVIVFEGTSLPEVTDAPRVGLAVPMGDIDGLVIAMHRLITDEPERLRRGQMGRVLAEQRYNRELFTDRLVELYGSVIAGRGEAHA